MNTHYFQEEYLSKVIGSLNYWSGQRMIMEDHLEEMFREKLAQLLKQELPEFYQVITLCEMNGKLFIVDGQHRIRCAERLMREGHVSDVKFCFEVIKVSSEEGIHNIFCEINKSKPVPINYTNPSEVVRLAFAIIYQKYGGQFDHSERIVRPKISTETFKDLLTRVNNYCNFTTPEQLVKLVMATNDFIRDVCQTNPATFLLGSREDRRIRQDTINKCVRGNLLFFGIFKRTEFGSLDGWFSHCFEQMDANV